MKRSAFTLIELLVVIAIIAILAVVVVLTLNPAQLLAQSRDANRVSDMATLQSAINIYLADGGLTLGTSSFIYSSLPDTTSTCANIGMPTGVGYACVTSDLYRDVGGAGWIPVNFKGMSTGAPFGSLPVDPVNQTSSGFYYTYATNGGRFQAISGIESQKYKQSIASSLGPGTNVVGTTLETPPVGWWSFDEGTSGTVFDQSGNAANGGNGMWAGTPTGTNGFYSPGRIGPWAGAFDGATNCVTAPSPAAISNLQNFTGIMWVKIPASTQGYSMLLDLFNGGDATAPFQIMKNNTNNLIEYRLGSGAALYQYTGTINIFNNAWHLVAVTYNGTALIGYVDKVVDINKPLVTSVYAPVAPVSMGCRAGLYRLTGLIDDVRIYNRALSAAEIAAIYDAGR